MQMQKLKRFIYLFYLLIQFIVILKFLFLQMSDNNNNNNNNIDKNIDNNIDNNIDEEITQEEKDEMIKKIAHYRNVALSFINAHKKDLVSIYLQHIKNAPEEDKLGVLGINMVDMEERQNIDVAFLPMKILHIELVNNILERQKENNENIIYFLMINPIEEKLIEIDIRTLMSE
jgi:hypothetical protein